MIDTTYTVSDFADLSLSDRRPPSSDADRYWTVVYCDCDGRYHVHAAKSLCCQHNLWQTSHCCFQLIDDSDTNLSMWMLFSISIMKMKNNKKENRLLTLMKTWQNNVENVRKTMTKTKNEDDVIRRLVLQAALFGFLQHLEYYVLIKSSNIQRIVISVISNNTKMAK